MLRGGKLVQFGRGMIEQVSKQLFASRGMRRGEMADAQRAAAVTTLPRSPSRPSPLLQALWR